MDKCSTWGKTLYGLLCLLNVFVCPHTQSVGKLITSFPVYRLLKMLNHTSEFFFYIYIYIYIYQGCDFYVFPYFQPLRDDPCDSCGSKLFFFFFFFVGGVVGGGLVGYCMMIEIAQMTLSYYLNKLRKDCFLKHGRNDPESERCTSSRRHLQDSSNDSKRQTRVDSALKRVKALSHGTRQSRVSSSFSMGDMRQTASGFAGEAERKRTRAHAPKILPLPRARRFAAGAAKDKNILSFCERQRQPRRFQP